MESVWDSVTSFWNTYIWTPSDTASVQKVENYFDGTEGDGSQSDVSQNGGDGGGSQESDFEMWAWVAVGLIALFLIVALVHELREA